MKVIAMPNQSHHDRGEMIDLCTPATSRLSGAGVGVWATIHVDFFHESGFYDALKSGKIVELDIKGIIP